jgi:hypothetical protein
VVEKNSVVIVEVGVNDEEEMVSWGDCISSDGHSSLIRWMME